MSPSLKGCLIVAAGSLIIGLSSQATSQTKSLAAPTSYPETRRAVAKTEAGASDQAARVLAGFTEAETKVREALNQYMFKRDVTLQTIGPNGEVTGEYIRNSQFVFDDHGRRIERVLYHPKSTISTMRITKEDIQDLAGAQLLGIDVAEASKYRVTFAGTEVIDSVSCYAVEVRPAIQPDPNHMSERYFVGRVWLNPETLQIAKVRGTVEPQGKQRFPLFETWRSAISDGWAFPSRTEADDVLHFNSSDVHYRIKVRYYDYKLFGSKVSVKELDDPDIDSRPDPQPVPPPAAPEKSKATKPTGKLSSVPVTVIPPAVPAAASCTTDRSAPPVGPYHWPAGGQVRVFFIQDMFTAEQREGLLQAMATWSAEGQQTASGVRFIDAGDTTSRMSCRGCLTVGRKDIYKQDRHHYAFFHPMEEEEGRLLVSAWIDFDFGIKDATALKGFMTHELGHGLGLWDCTTCKKKQTIMNGFPGMNRDNGLLSPSACDIATVRDVYSEERQLSRVGIGAPNIAQEPTSYKIFKATATKDKNDGPSKLADTVSKGPRVASTAPANSTTTSLFQSPSTRANSLPASQFTPPINRRGQSNDPIILWLFEVNKSNAGRPRFQFALPY